MSIPAARPRQTPPARPAEPGPRALGQYEIKRAIGHGGMATVYEARDTQLGRTVAIKLVDVPAHLPPAEVEALVGRMRREARAIGSLSHPNVVGILDVGEENGLPFLVMEYLDGVTLRERIDTGGPLAPATAAAVLKQIAQALEAAHARGMLHRDIKPSNVMLLASASDAPADSGTAAAAVAETVLPRVKLLDFGVARQIGDTMMTRTGLMVGSPAYMAPETIRGESVSAAADIWALGALAYEMLAGRPAFSGDTIPAVFYQILEQAPAPIPGVCANARRVLARALDKIPEKRFGSALELAHAFEAAVAPPPSPAAAALRSGARRFPRRALAAAAVIVSALVLASLALTLLRTPRAEKKPASPGPLVAAAAGRPVAATPRSPRVPKPAPIVTPSVSALPAPSAPRPHPPVRRPAAAVATAHLPRPTAGVPHKPAPARGRPAGSTHTAKTTPAIRAPRVAPVPARRSNTTKRVATGSSVRTPPAKSARQRQPRRSLRPAASSAKTARTATARRSNKRRATNNSLLERKLRLLRDFNRLRREANRVNQKNPKAVAAYNRKVYAFRATRQRFNAAVQKARRGNRGGGN